MGGLDEMITFSVLVIVMILVCVSLVILGQELGRPIFLEGVFGLNSSTVLSQYFMGGYSNIGWWVIG
jgi:small basic protein